MHEKDVDLEKLRKEVERVKKIINDPEEVKKRKKEAEERYRKRYGYSR